MVFGLWAHRSYKARTLLKVYLAIISTVAFQMSIWARDHRVHYTVSEMNAEGVMCPTCWLITYCGSKHKHIMPNGFVFALMLPLVIPDCFLEFPWNYKAAELSSYGCSMSTAFIDICAWLGLAYDLKTVLPEMIKNRVNRTGNGAGMS